MSKSLKAGYGGGSFKKKNHYKLKDGDSVYRIIPPMTKFTNDERGWARFHSVHFGYKNTEGKLRMFESSLVKDHKTKPPTIKTPDAALDRLNDLKAKLDEAKKTGNEPLAAKLGTLVGFGGIYNVDNNWHMNVVGLDGNIGELKIRHKAKLALQAEIDRLEKNEKIFPLSEEDGRYFVFTRTGSGNETNFKVSVYTQKVEAIVNGKSKQIDEQVSHTITPELWNRLEEEAFDLNTLFNKPTAEEVAQIVAESDILTGKSAACDRIFDARWKAQRDATNNSNNDTPDDEGPDAPDPIPPTAQLSNAKPTVAANALGAPLSSAVTTPTVAQAAQAVAPKQTQAQSIEELSDDDFFKEIGVKVEASA